MDLPKSLTALDCPETIKQDLHMRIGVAKQQGQALPHFLLVGPHGQDMATFAKAVANEMGVSANFVKPTSDMRPGDLFAILTNTRTGDLVVCEQIELAKGELLDYLIQALDFHLDIVIQRDSGTHRIPLKSPHFTFVGTTSNPLEIDSRLRRRLIVYDFVSPQSQDNLLDELNSLVGLESVKKEVLELVNFLKVQQLRKAKNLPTVPISLHLVFYGNPGTGKTTVARLLSQIYRSLGILTTGHLVETDRSGLVAGYVGQTALKVQEVVSSALGGILFIDEAYSLVTGSGQDYGQEAIAILLKEMEDHRDDFVVVVAGYTDKMEHFFDSNPGLRSRFNRYLRFEDYTPPHLIAIFESFGKKAGYQLSPQARETLASVLQRAYDNRDETFGNARLARNLFEAAISNQASRIVPLANISKQMLSMIESADIPNEEADNLKLTND